MMAQAKVSSIEIAQQMRLNQAAVREVISRARASGIDIPAHAADARDLERNIANMADALRQALPVMRMDLRSIVECEAELDHRADGGFTPRIEPLSADGRRIATPPLEAIRAAEAIVGRIPDGQPAWLDDIIDGRRPL